MFLFLGGAVSTEHPNNPRNFKERERDRGLRNTNEVVIETYVNNEMSNLPKTKGILPASSCEVTPIDFNDNISGNGTPSEFPREITVFSGNPFAEVTQGILHLYKKNERKEIRDGPSNQLCLLAVPASMSCHDLLKFVAPCHAVIQHIRIIKDGSPNQFIVLLEFRTNESALEFYQTYNGVAYNSLEPDSVCHIIWVSSVEWSEDGFPPLGHIELPICPGEIEYF